MTILATDPFTGTGDSALSANWTSLTGGGQFTAPKLNGNEARNPVGNPGVAYYSGSLVGGGSWPNDQYVEVVVGSVVSNTSDEGVGPAARVNFAGTTPTSLYFAQTNTSETKLYKWTTGGGYVQLGSNGAACAAGDLLRLIPNGTSISVTKNGTTIIGPVTDSTIASGSAGIWCSDVGGPGTINSFEGGNLTAGTPDQPQDGDQGQYLVEEDYDHHEGTADAQVALGGDNLAKQSYEAEWDDEDYDGHDGSTDAQPITVATVLPLLQSFEAEFDEEGYDAHDGSTDAQALVASNDTSNVLGDADDSVYWDGDDELDIADDYDISDPERLWSEADEWVDDDYDQPDGSTDQVPLGGDQNIRQSFEAEYSDDDYDHHEGTTEPNPREEGFAESFAVELDEEDYDHHEGVTEPNPREENFAQSFEAEFADDEFEHHDRGTNALVVAIDNFVPPSEAAEDSEDFALGAQVDGYQQANNAPDTSNDPGAGQEPDGDEADDLDVADDYDNTDPDRAWDEPPIETDDDYDHHEANEPSSAAVVVDPNIKQSFEAELGDEDYDEHLGSPEFAQIVATAPDFAQSFVAEEDEDLYEEANGAGEPVNLGGDNEVKQSFEAEWDDDDFDAHDGSTDAQTLVAVVPDCPQSIEADLQDDDAGEVDDASEQVALGGDNEIRQSFEAEWDDEDYDAHDGSSETTPAPVFDNEIKQSFEADWSDEGYDEHAGGTDALALFGADIALSFEAEWAEEDFDAHDGSTEALAVVIASVTDRPWHDGEEPLDDDAGEVDDTSAPVALGGDNEIRQSFDAEFDEEDYEHHDGGTPAQWVATFCLTTVLTWLLPIRSRLALFAFRSRAWFVKANVMTTREKRSSELRIFDFDFSADLPAGVTITSVISLSAEPTTSPAIVFGSPIINADPVNFTEDGHIAPAGTVVQVSIDGGAIPVNGQFQMYTLRCKANTSNGERIEGTVWLKVNDTPAL